MRRNCGGVMPYGFPEWRRQLAACGAAARRPGKLPPSRRGIRHRLRKNSLGERSGRDYAARSSRFYESEDAPTCGPARHARRANAVAVSPARMTSALEKRSGFSPAERERDRSTRAARRPHRKGRGSQALCRGNDHAARAGHRHATDCDSQRNGRTAGIATKAGVRSLAWRHSRSSNRWRFFSDWESLTVVQGGDVTNQGW